MHHLRVYIYTEQIVNWQLNNNKNAKVNYILISHSFAIHLIRSGKVDVLTGLYISISLSRFSIKSSGELLNNFLIVSVIQSCIYYENGIKVVQMLLILS